MNFNSISPSIPEIKALERQKDGQQCDLIRVPFFLQNGTLTIRFPLIARIFNLCVLIRGTKRCKFSYQCREIIFNLPLCLQFCCATVTFSYIYTPFELLILPLVTRQRTALSSTPQHTIASRIRRKVNNGSILRSPNTRFPCSLHYTTLPTLLNVR